jgi:hypothetical protein
MRVVTKLIPVYRRLASDDILTGCTEVKSECKQKFAWHYLVKESIGNICG